MMNDVVKKKVGRPSKGKRGTFTFRVSAELREKLEATAASNERSISEEIEARITRSFAGGDILAEALGGHELRHLTLSFASSFADGCKSAARAAGHDDWTARDWLRDQDCYRAGIVRATMNLAEAMPNPSPQEKERLLDYLKSRMTSSLVQSGHLNFDFNDGRGPHGNEFVGPSAKDAADKATDDSAPEALESQEEWHRRELAHARTLTADKAADETRQEAESESRFALLYRAVERQEADVGSRFALLYRAVELKLELGEDPTEAELQELNQYCEVIGRLHKLAEARRSKPAAG